MRRNVFYVIITAVVFLLSACASLQLSKKDSEGEASLAPEFFTATKRIAVQDFVFAKGVKIDSFSPADGAFLRSVIESKIVELSGLEVITRKDQGLLEKEMEYKFAATGKAEDKVYTEHDIKMKMGVDAFIHGIIYEYTSTGDKYAITAAVKIVATENGRIWQSKIVSVSEAGSKHQLFDKLATIVAKNLIRPQGGMSDGQ